MALTNRQVFNNQARTSATELLDQQVEKFNQASNGAIFLSTGKKPGDYSEEALGSYLGGVHFELTGEDVTECTGGARGLAEVDLARDYRSQVDPRLNYEQALELAMRIAAYARSA